MRILFLSNFFPPARPGGYTQWCHEVAERLAERGHNVGVLTSRYELEKAPVGEQNIYRLFHLEGDLDYYEPIHFFTQWKNSNVKTWRVWEIILGTLPRILSLSGACGPLLKHCQPWLSDCYLVG